MTVAARSQLSIGDTFLEAWETKKDDGWTTFKHEEHWHHECPNCSD